MMVWRLMPPPPRPIGSRKPPPPPPGRPKPSPPPWPRRSSMLSLGRSLSSLMSMPSCRMVVGSCTSLNAGVAMPVPRDPTRLTEQPTHIPKTDATHHEAWPVPTGQAPLTSVYLCGITQECLGLGNFRIPLRQLLRCQESLHARAQRITSSLKLRNNVGPGNIRVVLANFIKFLASILQRRLQSGFLIF